MSDREELDASMSSTAILRSGRHVVDVDGVSQSFDVAGRSDGATCLVYAGGPGVDADYMRMVTLEQRLRVIYIDPPGTGRGDALPTHDYSVERLAALTRGIITRLGLHKPVLLGHSHGGCVGLELAISEPGLLGGLVAYSTGPIFGHEIWTEALKYVDAFAEKWRDRPEAVEAVRIWREGDESSVIDDATLIAHLRAILPLYFADYRRTVAELGELPIAARFDNRQYGDWGAGDRLRLIKDPVLVISGRCDSVCPERWATELLDGIKQAKGVRLDQSGHFGHLEESERFAREVADFVEGCTQVVS